MFSIACIFALVATASATHFGLPMVENNPLVSNRIVGGVATAISAVPYQISLQIGNFHTCGGSILTANYVLTAAHCVQGNEGSWNNYHVRVGSSSSATGGQYIKADPNYFYIHPSYNPNAHWTNDIAIIKLTKSIVFNALVKQVGLPSLGQAVPINNYATASGWGRLVEGGVTPTQLQSVQVPINDPSVCEQAYGSGFNRNTMVCAASSVGGQSTCQGDSGGPLVANGKQWGIVSWAQGCARPGYPTVFAHVANLRQFITNVVGI